MKLLAEMPKIAKCLKLRYSADFNKYKRSVGYYIIFLISGFPYAKRRSFIIKTERSDTIILGILAHFRHFSGLSGLGLSRLKIYCNRVELIVRCPAITSGIHFYDTFSL